MYQLRLGEEVILHLEVTESEFPWMSFHYTTTPSFSEVRKLFRARERLIRYSNYENIHKITSDRKRSERIWQKLLGRGLNFYDADSQEEACWFFFRIDRYEAYARFAFSSAKRKEKEEWRQLRTKYASSLE